MASDLLDALLRFPTAVLSLIAAILSLSAAIIARRKTQRDAEKTEDALNDVHTRIERVTIILERIEQHSGVPRAPTAARRPQKPSREIERRNHYRWPVVRVCIGAAVLVGFAVLISLVVELSPDVQWRLPALRSLRPHTMRTAIAEQRSVVLEDRSVIQLNTNSELSVAFTRAKRQIALKKGEARFTVAKDVSRPFIVATAHAYIQAIGTIFNVRVDDSGHTMVAVLEGQVKVSPRRARMVIDETDSLHLSMNNQATVLEDGHVLPDVGPPLERVKGWPDYLLIFKDEPLPVLLAELNRYQKHPMRIADPHLMECRMTLSLHSYERAPLVDYLRKYLGVRVEMSAAGEYLLYGESSTIDGKGTCYSILSEKEQ